MSIQLVVDVALEARSKTPLLRYLRNPLEMVVLPPQGTSGTYGQLPDTGADTIRAPRYGFARRPFTVKRMSSLTL